MPIDAHTLGNRETKSTGPKGSLMTAQGAYNIGLGQTLGKHRLHVPTPRRGQTTQLKATPWVPVI